MLRDEIRDIMPYRFIEEEAIADVAFEVWSADLALLFRDAGDALIKVMIENPEDIELRVSREIILKNDQLDLLLYNYLEQFIYYKDSDQLLLRPTEVKLQQISSEWRLRTIVTGEQIDRIRHHLVVDVKAVTLHDFKLENIAGQWRAHIILDI
jgi:SHS2 domain-containing protein